MVRSGLYSALRAVLLIALAFWTGAASGEDAETRLRGQLALQSALQQGRDNLQRGEYQAAVYCLEKEIARVDGNRDYMNALREAYRGYIRELQQTKRHADARTYQERLKILDPGYQIELNLTRSTNVPTLASLAAQSSPGAPPPAKPASTTYTARPQMPDESDPFADGNTSAQPSTVREKLDRARQEYNSKNYESANRLYEEANGLDGRAILPFRELWAFCKLYVATAAVNQAGWNPPERAEKEVLAALTLSTSPQLQQQGKELLRAIRERRIEVRHVRAQGQNWPEVETANFRIIYHESSQLAEQAARVAEVTRSTVLRKWFGEDSTTWSPKCTIFLFPNAAFYSKQTGKSSDWPGHSTLKLEGERVTQRRIDLHCDVADMLTHVLPHETTHAALFGRFGRHLLPRWADEGIAILSEPREKVERYLRNVPTLRSRHELFSLSELLSMNEYPEARRGTAFYTQSIALVDFLSSQKGGPQEFTRFIRDGLESGFETSLQRHYGFRDVKDLEGRWAQNQLAAPVSAYLAANAHP
jgi:tetratricopeptide (TPR) repeat protein